MIYEASSFAAFRDFNDKFRYAKDQGVWILLGLTSLTFFTLFDYKKLYYFAVPILIGVIVLLLAVLIPGIGIQVLGARRWIDVGFFIIQPSEIAKLGLAIYLSAWFSQKERGRFLPFILLLGFVLMLIMLQPNMGTAAIILALSLILYFLSGGSLSHFALLLPGIGLLGFILIIAAPYRAARLATYLNMNQSIDSSSYHVRQILIALGSGGLTGVGIGNSLQKYAYLPEITTDSIFAIIGEEFGFFGAIFVITLFIILIWRGFIIAGKASDMFGKLLAASIISFLSIQTLINLGAQTQLIPLTGIPLPFISYGGSALVINLTAIGILLSISRQGHSKK